MCTQATAYPCGRNVLWNRDGHPWFPKNTLRLIMAVLSRKIVEIAPRFIGSVMRECNAGLVTRELKPVTTLTCFKVDHPCTVLQVFIRLLQCRSIVQGVYCGTVASSWARIATMLPHECTNLELAIDVSSKILPYFFGSNISSQRNIHGVKHINLRCSTFQWADAVSFESLRSWLV